MFDTLFITVGLITTCLLLGFGLHTVLMFIFEGMTKRK